MADQYMGEIRNFGFAFAPKGWLACRGTVLPISQYKALFSLLGTTYGGDGISTFAVPDLQGRVSMGAGQGTGLSDRVAGEAAGEEQVTLTEEQIAPHQHYVAASAQASSKSPAGATPAYTATGNSYGTTNDLVMAPAMAQLNDGGLPHDNMPPYLVTNWCIALTGDFPSLD